MDETIRQTVDTLRGAIGDAIKIQTNDEFGVYWRTISVEDLAERIQQSAINNCIGLSCHLSPLTEKLFVFKYPVGVLPMDVLWHAYNTCIEALPVGSKIIVLPSDTTLENVSTETLVDLSKQLTDVLEERRHESA